MPLEPLDPPPLDPHHVVHYLAACTIARVPVARTSPIEMRALIARLSRLSIPDAVTLLRAESSREP